MSGTRERLALRLTRAEEHIKTLDDCIDAFVKDEDTYTVEADEDRNAGEIVVYMTPLREPPCEEWGVLIGDAVHQLRATLDNMVWDISVADSGPPHPDPIPSGNVWRSVSFPIVREPQKWPTGGPKSLSCVKRIPVQEFKDVQPFVTGQHTPDREPLAVLDELWNIDKHRHPALVGLWGGAELSDVVAVTGGFRTVWSRPPAELVLNAKTEIARIAPVQPIPASGISVHVEHNVAFEITFGPGAPAYGGDVTDTLREMKDALTLLVTHFESRLP